MDISNTGVKKEAKVDQSVDNEPSMIDSYYIKTGELFINELLEVFTLQT